MQPADSSPLSRPVLNPFSFNGDLSTEDFGGPRVLFLASLLLFQGGGMDLSKVGEKILSSVRSARSLGILSAPSDRPEVGTCASMRFSDLYIFSELWCGLMFGGREMNNFEYLFVQKTTKLTSVGRLECWFLCIRVLNTEKSRL